ncbi:hypothetical protein Tco_0564639 [Tanacetum coccineum]
MHVTADDDDAFDLRASLDIKSVGKALVGSADFEALFLDLIRNVNDEFDACIVISFFLLAERLLKREDGRNNECRSPGKVENKLLFRFTLRWICNWSIDKPREMKGKVLKEVVKKVLSLQSLSSPTESLLYLEVEASLFLNVVGLNSEELKLLKCCWREEDKLWFAWRVDHADQGVEGVVAVAGDALKVFTIERFGDFFNKTCIPLRYKPCCAENVDGDDDDTLSDPNQINGFLAFELLTQSQHVFWCFKMSRLSAYACTVNFHDKEYGTPLAVGGYNKRSNLCRRCSRV